MERISFFEYKAEIINELEILYSYHKNNDSYKYLINRISELTPNNIKEKRDQLLYFLIDSYDGDNKIKDKISSFLRKYK